MKNFFFATVLLLTSQFSFGQDTVYCCTAMDTYVAAQCDLIFKDSICFHDKKPFTGTLVINCVGDAKSRRGNGIYTYEAGKQIGSKKLPRDQKLQSGIPLKISSSSQRKFSGGMRKQYGGDHNETYEFLIELNAPVRIDSILHLNKVFIPADSLGLFNSNVKFRVINSFSGSTGIYTTAATLEIPGSAVHLTDYYTGKYQLDALRIYYTLNGVQQFATKKEYDSIEHNAAP